jgi:N6-L-threonylcarbamoyladenine synthase
VVPEVASRRHLEVCLPMVREAVGAIGWDAVDAIAVTQGPGLIGCLLMGVETAKALAWVHAKPLIPVHHLLAHLYALYVLPEIPGATHLLMEAGETKRVVPMAREAAAGGEEAIVMRPAYPHLGLVVSGGHTSLVWVTAPGQCEGVAVTVDDAAGEAYDKVARLLGLGYPGGPIVDRLAAQGDAGRFRFTPPMMRRDRPDFSFSGLKTAVAREIELLRAAGEACEGEAAPVVADLCAGFQAAVVEALLTKTLWSNEARGARDVLVVGGVACNRGLRRAAQEASRGGPRFWFPHPSLCTDNAAMIAGLAHHLAAVDVAAGLELNPRANWPMAGAA